MGVVELEVTVGPFPIPVVDYVVLVFLGTFVLNDLAMWIYLFTFGLTVTDSHHRITWDVYFHGSIVSTVTFQTTNSFLVLIFLSVVLAMDRELSLLTSKLSFSVPIEPFIPSLCVVAIVSSLVLIAFNIQACYRRPKQIWKLSVKEVGKNGTLNSTLSFFGHRRAPEDDVRKFWAPLFSPLKDAILRRTYVKHFNQFVSILNLPQQGSRKFDICTILKHHSYSAGICSHCLVCPTLL
jgi:hypothetical protein